MALLKLWVDIAMTAPFFTFLVPLCTGSLLAISPVPLQGLKRARVLLFMGETVVGRPTGMFVSDKDRELFQRGRTGEWTMQALRLWIVLVAIFYFRGDPSVNFGSLVSVMQCRSMQFLRCIDYGAIHEMKQIVANIIRISGRIC